MSGEEFGFEQIHAAFRPKIHRYLIRLVGELEAEDLTQEVFMRVNRSLKTFRGESELSTWIYRIATHAAIDVLRSPAYQRAVKGDSSDPDLANLELEIDDRNAWTGEKNPWVEPQVFRKEMNQCIQGLIEKLPEAYRTVLVLSEFEGLKNEEIAAILGVSLDSVKIRLHRARERLKEALAMNCPSYWAEDNEFIPELRRAKK